ncbi:MAG: hypothetical protein JNL49_04050 [Bacteroidia bacterium]|jgi:hypothetical protein|nr:hypothetical protein [Bacteroidia bacterium]
MSRTTRNNLASYVLFIYGCLLQLLLIITLESEPTKTSYFISILLGAGAAMLAAMFGGTYTIGMHFLKRNVILFILLTIAEISIWYLVCEGTFELKG